MWCKPSGSHAMPSMAGWRLIRLKRAMPNPVRCPRKPLRGVTKLRFMRLSTSLLEVLRIGSCVLRAIQISSVRLTRFCHSDEGGIWLVTSLICRARFLLRRNDNRTKLFADSYSTFPPTYQPAIPPTHHPTNPPSHQPTIPPMFSFTPEPFSPARGLSNPHLQTIVANYWRSCREISFRRQRVETPDGDFVDLDFAEVAGATYSSGATFHDAKTGKIILRTLTTNVP